MNYMFMPSSMTITVGDSIRATNKDSPTHTFTDRGHSWDSGSLSTGQSWTHQFLRAGTFTFECTIHPFMTGTLTVAP